MGLFNRFVAILLWLGLLALICLLAISPFDSLGKAQALLESSKATLHAWQTVNPTNFLIAQIAVGVVAIVLFGTFLCE